MKFRESEYLKSMTGNNRTVAQNVENGMKAWFTRQQKLVEKAIQSGIDVSGIVFEYVQANSLYDNDYSIQGIISKELGYIRTEGFYRFGDRNTVTNEMKRSYFREDGRHIDDLAEELSNRYNREITPCNIADFIREYPNRNYELFERVQEAGELFRQAVGFNLTARFVSSFLCRTESVVSNCPF